MLWELKCRPGLPTLVLLEITHAAGYEHPCQFTMNDIQVNVDDDYLSSDLEATYGYKKYKVDFKSMQELYDCVY